MRQLDAELRRFYARRIVRIMFVVAVALVALVVTIGTAKGHPGDEPAAGSPTATVVDPATGRTFVQYGGNQNSFTFPRSDTRTNIGKDLRKALEGTGVALLFAGFAIGASFVGAEFNVGSLTTQLLFEPRRGRLHAAKAAAVGLGTGGFALAVLVLVAFAMYVGSAVHGVLRGVDSTFVIDRAGEALRIAAAVGAGATMTYCVTLVARRSSAGMIAFYVQYPLLFLLNPVKMPFGLLSHYAPLRGLLAVAIDPAGATGTNERTIHTMAGGVVLTIVSLIVILAASGSLFARSEVR